MTTEEIVARISDWQRDDCWSDIKASVSQILAERDSTGAFVITGEARAFLHYALSNAWFFTIEHADDWQKAIYSARQAVAHAPTTSALYGKSLYKLGAQFFSVGKLREAKRLVQAFMVESRKHVDELAYIVPLATRTLGNIAYREGRYVESIRLRRQALFQFEIAGDALNAARTSLNLVWSLVRAGRHDEARRVLPMAVPESLEYLWYGASCAVLAAEGRYHEAIEDGKHALSSDVRHSVDFVDAADIALILSDASRRLGRLSDAYAYFEKAVRFAARQRQSAWSLLVLRNRGRIGGESLHEAATVGVVGTYYFDACYSTGIA